MSAWGEAAVEATQIAKARRRAGLLGELNRLQNNFGLGSFADGRNRMRIEEIERELIELNKEGRKQ